MKGRQDSFLYVLRSYLTMHFLAATEQGRVLEHLDETGCASWALFNTGLLTRKQERPIFAVFKRNEEEGAGWSLCTWATSEEVCASSQPWNRQNRLLKPPTPPAMIESTRDLIFCPTNPAEEFDSDEDFFGHVEAIADSFPSSLQPSVAPPSSRKAVRFLFLVPLRNCLPQDGQLTCEALQAVYMAMKRARELAQYNPSIGVPHYVRPYGNRGPADVQMLLPLKLEDNSDDTHLALVLNAYHTRKGERVYRAASVLPLANAYICARIIMPVSQPWLLNAVSQKKRHSPKDGTTRFADANLGEQENRFPRADGSGCVLSLSFFWWFGWGEGDGMWHGGWNLMGILLECRLHPNAEEYQPAYLRALQKGAHSNNGKTWNASHSSFSGNDTASRHVRTTTSPLLARFVLNAHRTGCMCR